jgi:hypothetical protein
MGMRMPNCVGEQLSASTVTKTFQIPWSIFGLGQRSPLGNTATLLPCSDKHTLCCSGLRWGYPPARYVPWSVLLHGTPIAKQQQCSAFL